MTTLIARANKTERAIYGDSRVTTGRTISSEDCTKVFKIDTVKGPVLVGFCGALAKVRKALEAIKVGDLDDLDVEDSEILVVYKTGPILIVTEDGVIEWPDDYCCTGSGGDFARSALALGADPKKAIQHASQFDTGTNSKVKMVSFK